MPRSSSSSSDNKKVQRSFKIDESSIGFVGGSYKTDKTGMPLSAARRAAKVLFRMAKNEKGDAKWKKFQSTGSMIKFTLKEKTRGSDKDVYQYVAKYKTLHGDDIKTVKRGNIEYKVTSQIVVRAAKFTPIKGGEDIDF